MSTNAQHLDLILDLEARHDDLIQRLDDLDQRTAKVLADCLVIRQPVNAAEPAIGDERQSPVGA